MDPPSKRWYEKNAFPFLSQRKLKRASHVYPSEFFEAGEIPKPHQKFSRLLLETLKKNDRQQDLDHVQTPTVRPMAFYMLDPEDRTFEKRFYFVEPRYRDLEQRFAKNQGFYSPRSKHLKIRDHIYIATPSGNYDSDLILKRKKRAVRNPFGKEKATTLGDRTTFFFPAINGVAGTRSLSNIDTDTGKSRRMGLRSVLQRNTICVISNDCAWT